MNEYEQTPYRSSKNTKKWCKGKVSVEHVFETRRYPKNSDHTFADVDVCINCGKNENWETDFMKAWAKEHPTGTH